MPSLPNWPAATDELIRHLQALIRLDTTNPPGNEIVAAEYIAGVLRAEGIEPVVLESAPGRGNVVARLKGRGDAPPLLLFSHTDVVGVEPQFWTHPPFGGEIYGGYLYGRGAVDMKGTVAMQLVTFLLLKRCGESLARDVIFAATADEEHLGSYGIAWIARHYPDLIRAEYGLSEIGGYPVYVKGRRVFLLQAAEKGTVWLKARAKGKPGHASMPHDDNAVAHLSRAVERIARRGLPFHLTAAASGFLDGFAEVAGPGVRLLKNPFLERLALRRAIPDESQRIAVYATLHNTATPTGLQAGIKHNVIPSQAEALIDGRTLPGFTTGMFLEELRPVLGKGIEIEVLQESPPLEARLDTPLYAAMVAGLRRHAPDAVVVPYMMSGATDAKCVAPLGIQTYGFSPLDLRPGDDIRSWFHSHDERVPLEGLAWGLPVFYEVVRDFCR
ncbi:MAG: M20/M25/M40 family metallo-hydrolase [Chloroflexi bacterium]|nr:M20/M25/M40 family metallo-hydrolase [Chloroflexota bacterium]